jgi:hypothetical protein
VTWLGVRAAGRGAVILAGVSTILACAGPRLPIPAGPMGSVAVDADTAIAFQQRAEVFYQRLIQRRFNTLETFNDHVLREHFRSRDLFYDYYADLAQNLSEAHFEKSRPLRVQVQEFLFDSPEEARIQVRFVGDDGRPLRPGRVALIRRDRWERVDGGWWLVPGKL